MTLTYLDRCVRVVRCQGLGALNLLIDEHAIMRRRVGALLSAFWNKSLAKPKGIARPLSRGHAAVRRFDRRGLKSVRRGVGRVSWVQTPRLRRGCGLMVVLALVVRGRQARGARPCVRRRGRGGIGSPRTHERTGERLLGPFVKLEFRRAGGAARKGWFVDVREVYGNGKSSINHSTG